MSVITITKENFQSEVIESKIPVLIDFWAPWCSPCRMAAPIIEEISNQSSDYKVCKINVDEQPDLAVQYDVMSIPTLLVFKNGEVFNTAVGVKSKEAILDLFE